MRRFDRYSGNAEPPRSMSLDEYRRRTALHPNQHPSERNRARRDGAYPFASSEDTTTRYTDYRAQHTARPQTVRHATQMNATSAASIDAARSSNRLFIGSIATLLAVFALVITLISGGVFASAADQYFPKGSGTASDPFQISTAKQMQTLATLVNGGNSAYSSKCYILTDNIDLSSSDWTENTVIGLATTYKDAQAKGFKGVFDGNGYTISNLTLDIMQCPNQGKRCIGLFGATQGATIHDLNLSSVKISGTLTGDSSDIAAGCLIGQSILTNVYNCNVLDSSISDTSGGHKSEGNLCAFGGLIGDSYSNNSTATSVKNCSVQCDILDYTTTTVTGTSTGSMQVYAGGIVGRIRVQSGTALTAVNCAFTGSIAANGFVAPIFGGTRIGDINSFTSISAQSYFEKCYFNASLSKSDKTTAPNANYNLTYSSSSTGSYVYNNGVYNPTGIASSYRMDSTEYSSSNIGNATSSLNSWANSNGYRGWRIATTGSGIRLPILDMRSISIAETSRVKGIVTIGVTIAGGYPGETVGIVNPVWRCSNGAEISGGGASATMGLQSDATTVTLSYAYEDDPGTTLTTSCTIDAIGAVKLAISRVYNAEYTQVTELDGTITLPSEVAEDTFTYQWYKSDSATAETKIADATGLTIDVSDTAKYPKGTKFTLKATWTKNTAISYTATMVNQGSGIYVRAQAGSDGTPKGDDANNGRTPDTPVETLARAYELIDSTASADSNVIVIIGPYTETKSFGIEDSNYKSACTLNKPATITGSDQLTEEDTTKYPAGVLSWYNISPDGRQDATFQNGKLLNADTVIENITLSGNGTSSIGYIYCQGHNLTIGENVTMTNYRNASDAKSYGLLGSPKAADFNIVGGYLNWDKVGSVGSNNDCSITIKSGSFSRIIAGSRNTVVNANSHNVFGSESDYFKVTVNVDIEESTSMASGYNCDIAMLCGGQTDGSIYAATDISVKAGTIKMLTGSSIGYNRDCGDGYPNNDYTGVLDIDISGGSIDYFYGGCLGRWVDNKSKVNVIDSSFKSSSAIEKAENRGSTPDIDITLSGGTIAGNVFAVGAGGTTGSATNKVSVGITVSGSTIKGNVYGGGFGSAPSVSKSTDAIHVSSEAGVLYGSTTVTVSGGTVEGNVYGGGGGTDIYLANTDKRALAQVYGDTNVNIVGGTVGGSVFAAGDGIASADAPDMARVTGNAKLVVSGGSITGSAYGGGNYGVVGQGSTSSSSSALPYTVTSAGSTEIIVTGGTIAKSVFGGGEGAGTSTETAAIKGAIFGSSVVRIYGGTIGEDVFGGGNESRTYAPVSSGIAGQATKVILNSTNEQIRVNESTGAVLTQDDSGYAEGTKIDTLYSGLATGRVISLGGSVFGGANRSASSVFQANDYTVFGDTNVYIKGTDVDFNGDNGGVYGDGNLSRAYGTRDITMIDFYAAGSNSSKTLKSFYSLQRADRVILSNTDIYMMGALDRINSTDTSKYSINRVDELKLYNGSTIQLDTTVNGLGSLWSDVATDRSFRTNTLSDSEMAAYRAAYADGTAWEGSALNTVILNNGKWLEVKYADDSAKAGAYGQVTGLFTLSLLQVNIDEGGAFVYGADGTSGTTADDSTGHFCCVNKDTGDNYLTLYTVQENDYRIWYIKGGTYRYDLTIKGYTTGGTTISTEAWLPVNYISDKSSDNKITFDSSKAISIPSSISDCLVGKGTTPGGNQFHLDMAVNGSSNPYYFTDGSSSSDSYSASYGDVDLVPVTFSMDLGSNLAEQSGTVSFQMKDSNGSTYIINLTIIIEKPVSIGYCISHYGKIYGDVNFASSVAITGKSAYSAEFVTTYSPSAYPNKSWSIRSYATSALNGEDAGSQDNNFFFAGTKITMVDITNSDNPQYYYYVCSSNQSEINLDDFTNMGSAGTKFSTTKIGNTVVREKLVFIIDLDGASGIYGSNQYITLRHSYNNGADDMLRFSSNSDGETTEHYVPFTGNAIVPENYRLINTGISSLSTSEVTYAVSDDFQYDTYTYNLIASMRTDLVNTRFLDNTYSIFCKFSQNIPLDARISVTKSDGSAATTSYCYIDGSRYLIADVGDNPNCTVSLQLSRYMRYGRFVSRIYGSEVFYLGIYSSPDGLYFNDSDVGNVNINNTAYLAKTMNIYSYLPHEEYDLKLNDGSPTVSGTTVTAKLTAYKKIQSGNTSETESSDLAPNNGLVVKRYVQGSSISSAIDVSGYVTPSKGNTSGNTTNFTMKDTSVSSGTTYVYQFRYGTTFETATVAVP